jgi:hypothetical protein
MEFFPVTTSVKIHRFQCFFRQHVCLSRDSRLVDFGANSTSRFENMSNFGTREGEHTCRCQFYTEFILSNWIFVFSNFSARKLFPRHPRRVAIGIVTKTEHEDDFIKLEKLMTIRHATIIYGEYVILLSGGILLVLPIRSALFLTNFGFQST